MSPERAINDLYIAAANSICNIACYLLDGNIHQMSQATYPKPLF